jgi:hypothetical protein
MNLLAMSIVGRIRLSLLLVAIALPLAAAPPSGPATPRPCTARETRAIVVAFATAWTDGDLDAIRRLAAPEPHFRWVSAGPPGARFGHHATNRRSLAGYIARRHARNDRLAVRKFRFHGSELRGTERFGHFEFRATRDADDWPAGRDHWRAGKGAIICNLGPPVLAVFSLG